MNYMILIPDHQLQIRNTKIYSPKIKDPFKLVALGDTHVSEMMEKTKLYPVQLQIEKENPDYIALVGDIVDAPSQLQHTYVQKKIIEFVKAAAEVAPVFIVLGSHDYVDHKNQKDIYFYQRHFWEDIIGTIDNVHLLYNDTYQDQQAFFMGYWQTLDYYYNPNDVRHENLEKFHEDFIKYPELYQHLPEDTVRIALIHSPEFAKLEKNRQLIKDYDLLISGHMHDGCVPLGVGNFTTGLISPKKEFFPKQARGVFTLDTDTNVIVSGGIMKISDCAPKILHWANHLCPMQMDSITFTPGKEPIEITKTKVYKR